jgi:hypothetical protein
VAIVTEKKKPDYEYILGKGRDMASDEYPEDKEITVSANELAAGANRYIGPRASKAGAGRGKVNPVKGKDFAKGGKVTASRRGDGIAQRGKTKGRMV